jgi:hypothetical protein
LDRAGLVGQLLLLVLLLLQPLTERVVVALVVLRDLVVRQEQ